MKKCSKCEQFKSWEEFSKDRTSSSGYKSRCKVCRSIDKKEVLTKFRLNNPIKTRKKFNNKSEAKRHNNYKQYGLSLEDYNNLLILQNSVCAICKKPETMTKKNGTIQNLAVDHCHKTGKVRGLLCSKCNTGIGYFAEDRQIFLNAIEYLDNKKRSDEMLEES